MGKRNWRSATTTNPHYFSVPLCVTILLFWTSNNFINIFLSFERMQQLFFEVLWLSILMQQIVPSNSMTFYSDVTIVLWETFIVLSLKICNKLFFQIPWHSILMKLFFQVLWHSDPHFSHLYKLIGGHKSSITIYISSISHSVPHSHLYFHNCEPKLASCTIIVFLDLPEIRKEHIILLLWFIFELLYSAFIQ